MSYDNLFQNDLTSIIAEHNHSIKYGSNTYSCVVGRIANREENKIEGIWGDSDLDILIKQQTLTPEVNKILEHKNKKYRIQEIIKDDYTASYHVRCKQENF